MTEVDSSAAPVGNRRRWFSAACIDDSIDNGFIHRIQNGQSPFVSPPTQSPRALGFTVFDGNRYNLKPKQRSYQPPPHPTYRTIEIPPAP